MAQGLLKVSQNPLCKEFDMPEIAAAPSPVIAAPPTNGAANAATSTDTTAGALPDAGNGATTDPFSAMLQRLLKGKSGQSVDQDAAQLAFLAQGTETQTLTGDAASQEAMSSLMASLQAQMLGLQPEAVGKLKEVAANDTRNDAKDDALPVVQETDAQSVLGSLLASSTAQTNTALNKNAGDSQTSQTIVDDGKSDSGLAAKPAILAPTEGDNQIAQQSQEVDDFQSLLESARNLQTEHRPTQTQPQTHTAPRTEAKVETPVGHPQWGQEVGDKVAWMVGKQESRAELVLNPPQMGRIEVSITLNGDQASAAFNTTNPAVREALESALPRLREVLADAGVRLDQAQVGSDTRGDTPQQQERRDNSGHNNKVVSGDMVPGQAPTTAGTTQWVQQGNGMVDTFA